MPSQTPTTEAPKAQQPMQLESENQRSNSLVTTQPTSEPRPNANEPQLSLRGGGLNCGFDCCGGACRFHKSCC